MRSLVTAALENQYRRYRSDIPFLGKRCKDMPLNDYSNNESLWDPGKPNIYGFCYWVKDGVAWLSDWPLSSGADGFTNKKLLNWKPQDLKKKAMFGKILFLSAKDLEGSKGRELWSGRTAVPRDPMAVGICPWDASNPTPSVETMWKCEASFLKSKGGWGMCSSVPGDIFLFQAKKTW